MITACSTPNIALIKYWGNRNNELRLPAADSLSMTLSEPCVEITVTESDRFSVSSNNKEMKDKDIERFQKTVDLIKQYHPKVQNTISIEIDSQIPPGIGLASSAAVFSALAKAIAALADCGLNDEQISQMARLGSGSAARSIVGGFVALENTEDSAIARQIAPQDHWELFDIVIAPNTDHKKVGSTEGHASAWTSPHYKKRITDITERRQQECIDAIANKDFEKLMAVTEEDCLDMHHCMQTQDPPLHYLSDETYRIVDELKTLRKTQHLPLLYTMDAGPTVHVICEAEALETVRAYANVQKGCKVFEASVGKGAHLV
ncbi:diphosphomevalonate decarboxylase [Candidatus Peribacteria bacterium]|nr:diphosphomevalonate decarboxylase [Candidatus Peribacteria bacterium]